VTRASPHSVYVDLLLGEAPRSFTLPASLQHIPAVLPLLMPLMCAGRFSIPAKG